MRHPDVRSLMVLVVSDFCCGVEGKLFSKPLTQFCELHFSQKREKNYIYVKKKLFLIKGQSLISYEKATLELVSNMVKIEEY